MGAPGERPTRGDSRSEEDFRIDLGWIVARDGPAKERLLDLLRFALESLQADIATRTGLPWPSSPTVGQDGLPEAHAEVIVEENPTLRVWYGERSEPVLTLTSPHLRFTNMLLNTF